MISRNLKSLIRSYPLAVSLNFTGLVCAFVAFILIFHQVKYEMTFDRCHPTADRVFRADKSGDESIFRNVLPRGFSEDIIVSSSHIEAGCSIIPFLGETYFTIEGEGKNPAGFIRNLNGVSEGFIDVFGIKMIEGDSRALDRPNSVIIPESLAEVLFHGEKALGRTIGLDKKFLLTPGEKNATITGVYEDFPSNTQLENDLYMSVGDLQRGEYGPANFICYLLLDDKTNARAVCDEFNGHFDFSSSKNWLMPIELTPLTDIYFLNEGDIYKSGSRGQLMLLIAIGILILGIGLINFTNFYIALTPLRIRSINIQKILGSSTSRLRQQIAMESMIWCLSASLIAAMLAGPASRGLTTNGIMMQALSYDKDWWLIAASAAAAVLLGFASGIWPGIYSTSGQPAMILRGSFGLSQSGNNLRTLLVGLQFIVSMALLIFIFFVQYQSRFMRDYPCGFDKDNLAVVNIGSTNYSEKSAWLRETLRQLPEVMDVAYSAELVGGKDSYNTNTLDFGQESAMTSQIYCTWNFPELLGLELKEGHFFREGSYGEFLLTENLKSIGAELDDEIVGFVGDVNITSMRQTDAPVTFVSYPGYVNEYSYIRLVPGADRIESSNKILKVLREMDSSYPYEIMFYDSIGKSLYSGEERLRLSVWMFSILAILLSLIGIWGQVLMDVHYKRKEVSVRRVFGADFSDIVCEGLSLYLLRILLCFLIAAPVTWFIVRHYLQQFSHRVGMNPLIFIASLLTVSILCTVIVWYHYRKFARSNPSDSLKID